MTQSICAVGLGHSSDFHKRTRTACNDGHEKPWASVSHGRCEASVDSASCLNPVMHCHTGSVHLVNAFNVSFVLHTSVGTMEFSCPALSCPVIGMSGCAGSIVRLAQRAGNTPLTMAFLPSTCQKRHNPWKWRVPNVNLMVYNRLVD